MLYRDYRLTAAGQNILGQRLYPGHLTIALFQLTHPDSPHFNQRFALDLDAFARSRGSSLAHMAMRSGFLKSKTGMAVSNLSLDRKLIQILGFKMAKLCV